jgi:hypothetical protein
MICDRCYKSTNSTIMSMLNTQIICLGCKDEERKDPSSFFSREVSLLGLLDWDPTPAEVREYQRRRAGLLDEDDDDSIGDGGEGEVMAGMAHGNRGLAEYGGLETDRPGGTGCYGCGGRGCENCNWGDPD